MYSHNVLRLYKQKNILKKLCNIIVKHLYRYFYTQFVLKLLEHVCINFYCLLSTNII